ncbi:hypothetical protein [Methylotetracoccus oryzae]|uniref:hypothetical protein n=1 Tax=Methylotetracoccus oryzae TaxID=1919059 RepID=UPI001912EDD1|nr:hypothetical protein [Methylotetracoccus oryzae]
MRKELNRSEWIAALCLVLASTAPFAEEKSGWPVEGGAAKTQTTAPEATPAQKPAEGMGGMQHGGMMGGASQGGGMGGMQHGQMGGMNGGQTPQGGGGMMGGMSQGGGMAGMQHGGAGGGMMGGGMMGSMPAMSEQEKEELLKKTLELDLKLGQLRIRITQAADEAERERLKGEHRAVFKEYLPKLHQLMMQAHMEMKMQGGTAGQPMKH